MCVMGTDIGAGLGEEREGGAGLGAQKLSFSSENVTGHALF